MRESVSNYSRPGAARIRSRRSLGFAAFGFGLLWVLASLLVHPLSHRTSDSGATELFKGAEITPAVVDVFRHACINCHSEKTEWPWYSQVAPASWFVESDVKHARKRMDLSRWDTLGTSDQRLLLTAIGAVIENREMPPHWYLMLHPEAKLTADESVEVIEWTRAERRRLRESSVMPSSK